MALERVITGGQSGADLAGWEAARRAGIPTSGTMPPNFMTEDGPRPGYADRYGATELQACGKFDQADLYRLRTWLNSREADATVWFGDEDSPGGRCTAAACRRAGRSIYLASDLGPLGLAAVLHRTGVKTLNVAGNRASSQPADFGVRVEAYLARMFAELKRLDSVKAMG